MLNKVSIRKRIVYVIGVKVCRFQINNLLDEIFFCLPSVQVDMPICHVTIDYVDQEE